MVRLITSRKRMIAFVVLGWIGLAWGQAKVTHGPFAGAVTSESVRILVRTNVTADISFQLDLDANFTNAFSTNPAVADSSADYFVIIGVTGLMPDTRYFYRTVINGAPQAEVRSLKTFPEAGSATEFTFAFGSCQQLARDVNSYIGRVFPLIAQIEPRFFLQLGDWTYPDTTDSPSNPDDFFNVVFSRVQASYRAKYDPAYPMDELFKVAPIDYVYDDHDFSDNNSDGTFPGRENSLLGYQTMFPHYPLANPENGLWHKFTFGNADFFVLDTRTQRDPDLNAFQQDGTGKYVFQPGSGHAILQGDPNVSGEPQMDWLVRELQESSATWKFVCSGVSFNPGHRALLELALILQGTEFDPIIWPGGSISAFGLALNLSDSWNGFPASAQKLVRAVHDAKIANVIILSGDSHTAALDDGANSLFPEFMAGGLDRSNSRLVAAAELLGVHAWNQGGQTLGQSNFNSHFGKVTVFADDSVQVELIDEFGNQIASYTQLSGHLVSPVGLSFVAAGRDFGDVAIGDSAQSSILLISTSSDTVVVDGVSSSLPEFVAHPATLALPPGQRRDVQVVFRPDENKTFTTTITIDSNDPESPFFVELTGRGIQSTAVEEIPQAPAQFVLQQNYPNPFNPTTTVRYALPRKVKVSLTVYNLQGLEVARLLDGQEKSAGYHEAVWDGRDRVGQSVSSGVYFIRMRAGDFVQTRKVVLVR